MATPPVPPRPSSAYDMHHHRTTSLSPPPLPPVPPALRNDLESEYRSAPHYEDPLVAPRPTKLQPDLPANMVRTLDEQTYSQGPANYARGPSPYPPAPGFAYQGPGGPPGRGPSPLPPPQGSDWSPWAVGSPPPNNYNSSPYPQQGYGNQSSYPIPTPRIEDVAQSIAALSLGPQPQPPPHPRHRATSSYGQQPPPLQHQPTQYTAPPVPSPPAAPQMQPVPGAPPSLTAPLPTIAGLTAAIDAVRRNDSDPAQGVAWCKDVLALINRAEAMQSSISNPTNVASTDAPMGPIRIEDPQLRSLIDVCIPLIMKYSSPSPMPKPVPRHVAEAVYLRACCESSGAFASLSSQPIKRDPRTAFRDFEFAARNGHPAAWFKIGRDYENFGDITHAKDAFERGVRGGDERCLYRMGMANLMGQLGLPSSPETAVPLLYRAATLASVEVPQPAYVYGLLLLQEFSHVKIPPHLFSSVIPQGSNPEVEARKHLERAAYLNFAPAQYKLGHSYEFATPPFPFDALLSVQYYSLASQQGEMEADMALSKWFLCGSEGAFEKDEELAWTFAEKAARKGLPSAEFAMGYYAEVGVGGPKDVEKARKWYSKAAEHGNDDAKDRLQALAGPSAQALTRAEHDTLTEHKLVRTRTQAKQRSDASGARPPPMPQMQPDRIVDIVRKNSTMMPPAAYGPGPSYGAPPPAEPPTAPLSNLPASPRPASNPTSPRQRPAELPGGQGPGAQSSRPFANAARYSLADPGSGSAAPSPRPTVSPQSSFGPPRREGRPSAAPSAASSPGPPMNSQSPPSGPPRKGAQTFAEMGIATTKVEEKECIIM